MNRLSIAHKLSLQVLVTSLLLILTFVPCIAQTSQSAAKPDRGANSVSDFALSDIENINLGNGNLNISIPLASLPPIAGNKLAFTLRAVYNSKLIDTYAVESRLGPGQFGALIYYKQLPRASQLGGWRINGRYSIINEQAADDFVRLGDTGDPDLQLIGSLHKTFLITPDGSRHELRPIDHPGWNGNNQTYVGYFKEPNNVPVRYYSFDGSYLWVRINPFGSAAIFFEVYQKDGTKITQYTDGVQRITDTNGNSIKIFDDSAGTHYQDELTGREIIYSEAQGIGHVSFQTVTGAWVTTDITFGTTEVRGKAYDITTFCSPDQPDCNCTYQELYSEVFSVIREITLPATQPGVPRQKFSFSYNSDTTIPNPGTYKPGCFTDPHPIPVSSYGNGQLSEMQMPNGAVVKYTHGYDGGSWLQETTNFAAEGVTGKVLEHDGTTDIWTYFITETMARVTNPDNTTVEQTSYFHLPSHMSMMGGSAGLAGLVYRVNRAGIELTERHWTRLKFNGGQEEAAGGGKAPFNAVVDVEYLSILDGSGNPVKMSAKSFQYDFNGNVRSETSYDWFDPALVSRDIHGVPTGVPASATVLRTVVNTYYNSANTADSSNVYAKRALSATGPHILGAPQQTTVGPSIVQFSYDGQPYETPPTIGNLTSQTVWNDWDNKWITSSQTYDSYGNVLTRTDAEGNVTTFFYEDSTHAQPTKVEVDPLNGTGKQTTFTTYDQSTGVVTSQTDVNGNVSTISYTNQLLGTPDPFRRPGVVTGPVINVGGQNQQHKVTHTYLDDTRQLIVASDLHAENDKLLKTRTTMDMLGRAVLTERTEDGVNYTIAVRNEYDMKTRNSWVSNPMRATAATTDGWTRRTLDELGRLVSVATFAGAAQPSATATNWTGRITTSYSGNQTTVTDQAGKIRRSEADAMGRVVSVLEDPGGLGYLTTYVHDSRDNLRSVVQGAQVRTFDFDSMSRLRRAINPESGTTNFTYDDNGNVTEKSDARLLADNVTHVKVTVAYDGLNRPTSRNYNDDTPDVTYTYDDEDVLNSKGRLTSTSSSAGSYNYEEFDEQGRVKKATQTTDGIEYSMEYSYNLAGGLISQKYPSGRIVAAEVDDAARLAGVKNQANGFFYVGGAKTDSTNRIQYTAFSAISRMRLGNTLWEHYDFNSRNQPTQIGLGTTSSNSSVLQLDYTYGTNNNSGNIQSQTITLPGAVTLTQTYTYDQVNRLLSAQEMNGSNPSWQQSFTYLDQNGQNGRYGNRRFAAGTTPALITSNPVFDMATNRIQPQAGEQYQYDPAGNLTKDKDGHTLAYDADHRLTSYDSGSPGSVTFTYDAEGRRVKKVTGTNRTIFVYNVQGEMVAEYSDTVTPGQGTLYLTSDFQGSPRVVTRSNTTVAGRHDFLPFGEELDDDFGGRSGVAGYNVTDNVRQKFTSKERDVETGLDYFGARYYASFNGRFTGVDQGEPEVLDPQTWNRYQYARNNPLLYIDSDGNKDEPAKNQRVNQALATDPTLLEVIKASNNFSQKAFEDALNSGALKGKMNWGGGNTLRGLAGEAIVIDSMRRTLGFPVISQPGTQTLRAVDDKAADALGGAMPDVLALFPAFSVNIARLAISQKAYMKGVLTDHRGNTATVVFNPSVKFGLFEVKAGFSAQHIPRGAAQVAATATALRAANLPGIAVLIVDKDAFMKMKPQERLAIYNTVTRAGGFIAVVQGLAQAAAERARQAANAAK